MRGCPKMKAVTFFVSYYVHYLNISFYFRMYGTSDVSAIAI